VWREGAGGACFYDADEQVRVGGTHWRGVPRIYAQDRESAAVVVVIYA